MQIRCITQANISQLVRPQRGLDKSYINIATIYDFQQQEASNRTPKMNCNIPNYWPVDTNLIRLICFISKLIQ